jgi:hypothetical protein
MLLFILFDYGQLHVPGISVQTSHGGWPPLNT